MVLKRIKSIPKQSMPRHSSGIQTPHLGFLDRRTFSKQSRNGSSFDVIIPAAPIRSSPRRHFGSSLPICSDRVMPSTPIGSNSDDTNHVNSSITTSSYGLNDPPEEKDLSLAEVCERVHGKVEAFLNREPKNERVKNVQAQTRRSLSCIEEALRKYSLKELSLSYNGGKDCLVLLILYLTALHAQYGNSSSNSTTTNNSSTNNLSHSTQLPNKLNSVFILAKHPFEDVDAFVNFSVQKYHLDLSRYAKPMREAFSDYLSDHPNINAIFVGTRRTDPHGQDLTFFDPTDRGWPEFMRIHPVIDWHYAEIWTFILELQVEYCKLYDLGYTSLGGTTDTYPNPALAVKVQGGEMEQAKFAGAGRFRPAYELIEDGEERLGRDR